MATIDITHLYCVKTRDGLAQKDEMDVYLEIDGQGLEFVSGPYIMNKSRDDEHHDMNIHRPFSDDVSVQLRERNGDRGGHNDLVLETHDFDAHHQDPEVVAFSGNNGRVMYNLTVGVSV